MKEMKEIKLINTNLTAIVDDNDFYVVDAYIWMINNQGYAVTNTKHYNVAEKKYKVILMNRYIWELHNGKIPEGMLIDHIDRNPLNNQLSNLRLATPRENNRNKSKHKDNTSGFRGVTKARYRKKQKDGTYKEYKYWYATWIEEDNKNHTKSFPYTEEGKIEAAKWFDLQAKKNYGKFYGKLNFPDKSDNS